MCDFVYDDVPLIVTHPNISSPAFLAQAWSRDYGLEYAGTEQGFYRPLFLSLVWVVRTPAGPNPVVFRLVSLAVFCITVWLVYRLALALSNASVRTAAIAGALYAVHPARVETVSLVTTLPDLLVEGMGLLAAFLLLPRSPVRGAAALAAGIGLALAATLTKESGFFILAALAVSAAAHACRSGDWRPLAAPAIGIVLGLAGSVALRLLVGVGPRVSPVGVLSGMLGDQALPAIAALAHAARDLLVPGPVVFRLGLDVQDAGAWGVVPALVILSMAALWLMTVRSGDLALSLSTAWVGVNVFNVMLLAAAGYPYSQRYLAVAPAVALLCEGGRRFLRHVEAPGPAGRTGQGRCRATLLYLCMAVYLSAHAAYSVVGSLVCMTPLRFFQAMHAADPDDAVPLGALAQTLNGAGAAADAVEWYVRAATSVDATHSQVPCLHDMAIKRYLDDDRPADALRIADWSLLSFPRDADKLALRAVALARLGRFEDALAGIDAALAMRPDAPAYRTVRDRIVADMRRGAPAAGAE